MPTSRTTRPIRFSIDLTESRQFPGPLLSVALPVYNGANFLADALESFRQQGDPGWELVVADNASQDETVAIAESFARRDSRIRVERAARTLSQVENVNRAVRLCRGAWVQFLCHDDLLVPGALERVRREVAAADEGVGLIGHGTGMLYGRKFYVSWGAPSPPQPVAYNGLDCLSSENGFEAAISVKGADWLRGCLRGRNGTELPGLTNACVRRAAWEGLGGFDGQYMHFDLFLWLRLLARANYRFVPAMLTLTRIHGSQVAVEARRRMRSVADHLKFWPRFIRGEGAPFAAAGRSLPVSVLKTTSIGASAVAMELLQGRWLAAGQVALAMPVLTWLALPLFVARNYRTERRRTHHLRQVLRWDEIYP